MDGSSVEGIEVSPTIQSIELGKAGEKIGTAGFSPLAY